MSGLGAKLKRPGAALAGAAALYALYTRVYATRRASTSPDGGRGNNNKASGKSDGAAKTGKPAYKLDKYGKKKRRVAVDKEFVRRLRVLLRIVLPGVQSKEFALLCLHTAFLIARTLTSIYVAGLDGSIVRTIVERKPRDFGWGMCKWIAVAAPACYINSMLRYLESKLSVAFRTRLVSHCYNMYMKNETYYRVGNLDNRVENPDQCLTQDVSQFCRDLAELYSSLSKPCLDVVLMTAQLIMLARYRTGSGGNGAFPALLALGVISSTGWILKKFTPPFGKLVAEEARLYGELRAAHSRLITHSEEIAFYGGHEAEEGVLRRSYAALVKHMHHLYAKRVPYTMLEQFMMKYVWGACGMVMIAVPTFGQAKQATAAEIAADARRADTVSNRTQDFVTAKGLLISAADAIERMMSSWKQVAELAGRTERVFGMITVFDEVGHGKYNKISLADAVDKATSIEGETDEQKAKRALHARLRQGQGTILDDQNFVRLENVPVVTPNGDVLVADPGLTFDIQPGMHLLITGPNGCGKSSLFRMLGGLWPVRGGVLHKPGRGDMFYIPQRPYLSSGCLREQFIYPHTNKECTWSDDELYEMLKVVDLQYVVDREEGGFDSVNDWRDVLSGGEKQRVGMARVFYSKPHFAILDECTSAVSIDVEGQMYTHAKDTGITLLTVTHRPSLWKYHTHLLQFDGCGGWKFSALDAKERLSLQEEKASIETQLQGLPKLYDRLTELCGQLGESSIHQPMAAAAAAQAV